LLVSIIGALVVVLFFLFLQAGPFAPVAPHAGEKLLVAAPVLEIAVQPEVGVSGRPLSPAPTVTVQGAEGIPVAGVVVSVNLRDGLLADGSTLEVTTDDEGHAVFDNLRLARAGGYYLVFSAPGCASVSSAQFVVRFGPPRFLVVLREPLDGSAGSPVAGEPAVRVTDEAGNPVPGINVEVALEGNGDDLVGSKTVATNAEGVAMFSDLVIPRSGRRDYRLKFKARAAGVAEVTSEAFLLSDRG
jgi:hypothetical protein